MPSFRNDAELRVLRSLSTFISTGQKIQTRCQYVHELAPEQDARNWLSDVERFLGTELDLSYIDRFRNPAGLPSPVPGTDPGRYPNHAKIWTEMHFRLARLEVFSQELAQLTRSH
jgi:hypothetical protein